MPPAALILALGLALAGAARAQDEPPPAAPLPVMETIICYSTADARAFITLAERQRREVAAIAPLPGSCVETQVIAIPFAPVPDLNRFEAPVKTYSPGATSCAETRIEEVVRRVPVALRRQPARFFEAHAIYEDGRAQDQRALVLIPQRPYPAAFLQDRNRREAAGPCR